MSCELLDAAIRKTGEVIVCGETCKKDRQCSLADKPILFPKPEIKDTPESKVVFDVDNEDNSDFWDDKPRKETVKSVVFGDQLP